MDVVKPKVVCKNCGEEEFDEWDGFYYCRECGTQQDQMRAVEVNEEDDFNESAKQSKKLKIKKEKSALPLMTSFECCNYVLRGLVEELINFGVKENFKLVVLQVWAAFLRRKEIAFFSKTHAELPKLGIRYLERDALTLYNHTQKKSKKTKKLGDVSSNKSIISDGTNDSQSKRNWRKSKRNLDSSIYSSESSRQSSSTGGTVHAVTLKFSSSARKYMKRKMAKGHLNKHAADSEGSMACHRMPKTREIKHGDYVSTIVNIKQIYTIIAIALNLVQDDMQLSDLVNLIDGESLYNSKKVLQYFPKNVASRTKEILREIYFYSCPDKYSDKALRTQVGYLGRYLNIKSYNLPDMPKLIRRYVRELYLPDEVADFIERLINLLPLEVKPRAEGQYPAYEARAMALIIYVLKLFFGLDGQTELRISQASHNINEKLEHCTKEESPPHLFVWSEWMEYVEMRKVIVSQFNAQFSRKFQQQQSTRQKLEEELKIQQRLQDEQEEKMGEVFQEAMPSHVVNLQHIMELYLKRNKNIDSTLALNFPPTLTPATDYFNIIRSHLESLDPDTKNLPCAMPDFMNVNHTQRTLMPYLRAGAYRTLRRYLRQHEIELKLKLLSCNSYKEQVGLFRGKCTIIQENFEKADFNISADDWIKDIKMFNVPQKLNFITELSSYHPDHLRRLRRTRNKFAGQNMPQEEKASYIESEQPIDLKESSLLFNELNMDPIDGLNINAPRRHLGEDNIFVALSDVENEDETESAVENLEFLASNFDCWMLMGNVHSLWEGQKKDLLLRLPASLRWLLKTCAQSIGVDASIVYEELLVTELMFSYGVENLNEFTNCLRFRYNLPKKEINALMNMYREVW